MISVHVHRPNIPTLTAAVSPGAFSDEFTPGASLIVDSDVTHSEKAESLLGKIEEIWSSYEGAYFTEAFEPALRHFEHEGRDYIGFCHSDVYHGAINKHDGEKVDGDFLMQVREVAGYKMSYWRGHDKDGQIERYLHSAKTLIKLNPQASAHIWSDDYGVYLEVWLPANEFETNEGIADWIHRFIFEMKPVVSKPR